MFPGAGASVYYNGAGEPLGWDHPGDEPYDPDDYLPGYEDDDVDDGPDHTKDCDTYRDDSLPCTCGADFCGCNDPDGCGRIHY